MGRCTTVLLLAMCFASLVWAQAPASPPSAEQTSATAPASPPQSSTEAPWDKFKNFSALMTGGPVPGTADEIHIYRSGNLLRMEGPDRHSFIVQDLAKARDVRAVSKLPCLHMAAPFVRSYPFFMTGAGYIYETVMLGKETVDGHPTQIEEVTVTFPPANKHAPLKLKLWAAEDLQGFPVKIETPAHRTIEYRKVDFGGLDRTLFITPADCDLLEAQQPTKHSTKAKKAPAGKPE
jgi:hypothetical protein